MRKLMYRVVFPFELKLPNTTDDADGQDAMYSLFAVVVHVGSGPHHGAWGAAGALDGWWLSVSLAHSTPGVMLEATGGGSLHIMQGVVLSSTQLHVTTKVQFCM
jgi:hypothetical protein